MNTKKKKQKFVINENYEKMLANLDNGDSNVVFSPMGIKQSLETIRKAAKGNTKKEIEKAFGKIDKKFDDYNGGWAYHNAEISDENYEKLSDEEKKYCWKSGEASITDWMVINAKDDYVSMKLDYRMSLNSRVYYIEDDNQKKEKTVQQINNMIKEKTNGQMQNIVDKNMYEKDFVIQLGNIVNFNGFWLEDELEKTHLWFKGSDNKQILADGICAEHHKLIENDSTIGFAMPYAGGRHLFFALMSKNKGIESLQGLKGYDSSKLISSIIFPKFTVENTLSFDKLAPSLISVGIKDVFDEEKANLRNGFNFSKEYNMYISNMRQDAKICLDEKGTRASSVTMARCGIILGDFERKKTKVRKVRLIFNKPFVYGIYDIKEKEPLFLGRINKCIETNDNVDKNLFKQEPSITDEFVEVLL